MDPADESALLLPELRVQLLLEAEASDDGSQITLQRPLPVSGHQAVPVEQRCSRREQSATAAGLFSFAMLCHLDVF